MQRSAALEDFVDALRRMDLGWDGVAEHCVTCNAPVGEFRNDISRREYEISKMCQDCQDSIFGVD